VSADGVLWLPGVFRPLYHAVPDIQCRTDFGGVIVLWAACGSARDALAGQRPALPTVP
jgi:hypothetical protein